MKILLVEDSDLSRKRILALLYRFNYQVDWFTSADEVVRVNVDFSLYDICMFDLVLNGTLNGVELGRHVRSIVDVPIVFMSSFSQSELIESSTEFNPDSFIVKPLNLEQVKTAIQMAFHKFKIRKELRLKEQLVSTLRESQIEIEVEGREAERKRVASELHDGLGQMLTAIKLNINHLFKKGSVQDAIQDLKRLIDETISETHRISEDLSPSNIEHLPFLNCVRALINSMNRSKLHFHFENYDFPEDLEGKAKINLYRIIQEVINNAVKHSKAANFNIRLFKLDNLLRVMLEDDGVGIPKKAINSMGRGLQGIRSRIQVLNGEVVIESEKGEGTTIIVEFPYIIVNEKTPVS